MPAVLRTLKINEVSSVDRGAGAGVRVMLMKRDAALPPEVEIYLKRAFSDDKRKELEASGKAMPGGGYPIENVGDLENAIRAFGRAKDKAATKKHIIAQARALGATDKLPEGWMGSTKKIFATALRKALTAVGIKKLGAIDFDEAQGAVEAGEYAGGMLAELEEACCALRDSVSSIMCDDDCGDKGAALAETFAQFKEHIQGLVPEEMEKALAAGVAAAIAGGVTGDTAAALFKGATTMAEKTKKEEDLEKEVEKLLKQLAVAKMSQKHKDYADAMEMNDEDKAAFGEKTPAERDDHMEKHPVEKRLRDQLPESVRKQLAAGEAAMVIAKGLQDAAELATFTKRATAIGMPEPFGAVIQKAHAGDKAAVDEIVKALEAAINQAKAGGVFKEFGTAQATGAGATAYDQLVAKGAELRKADPKLTEAKAFEKAYTDPANAELVKLYKRETGRAAA